VRISTPALVGLVSISLESGRRRDFAEEALARAEYERVDHQPIRVNEVVLNQAGHSLMA